MKVKKSILIIAPYGFNDRMMTFIEFTSARLLARSGWKVTVVVRADTNISTREHVAGMTVFRCAKNSEGIVRAFTLLVSERPRLLHVHNLRNNRIGIAAALLARMLGIRLIHTEYGLLHDHYLTDDRDNPLNKPIHPERVIKSLIDVFKKGVQNPHTMRAAFSSYLFHWPLTHAHRLVFVSTHNLPIAHTLGLPPAQYLPHLSDTVRWSDTQADIPSVEERALRQKIKTIPEKSVIFVGQMKLRKGWDILLQAIPHIEKRDIETFVFVCSSSTSEKKIFTDMVDVLGVRDRILYLGKVPSNSLLREAYTRSAIVVVPSRYEGFGLVPLDAFDVQRPVVASDIAALNEYLTHGENAFLVPPKPEELASGLRAVMRNRELQKTLIAGGTKTLTYLQSDACAKEWLSFYDEQLMQGGASVS